MPSSEVRHGSPGRSPTSSRSADFSSSAPAFDPHAAHHLWRRLGIACRRSQSLRELRRAYPMREITVLITVSGRVSELDVSFSSRPKLPQEVLARVIFIAACRNHQRCRSHSLQLRQPSSQAVLEVHHSCATCAKPPASTRSMSSPTQRATQQSEPAATSARMYILESEAGVHGTTKGRPSVRSRGKLCSSWYDF